MPFRCDKPEVLYQDQHCFFDAAAVAAVIIVLSQHIPHHITWKQQSGLRSHSISIPFHLILTYQYYYNCFSLLVVWYMALLLSLFLASFGHTYTRTINFCGQSGQVSFSNNNVRQFISHVISHFYISYDTMRQRLGLAPSHNKDFLSVENQALFRHHWQTIALFCCHPRLSKCRTNSGKGISAVC